MKIIVLLGANSTGKTTTMNLVFNTIGGSSNRITIQHGSPSDFETDFNYKNKHIAIYSLGDTQKRVLAAIDKYKNLNVNVLIVAYNTKFKNNLNVLRPNNTFITLNKTANRQNQNQANIKDSNTIIANI